MQYPDSDSDDDNPADLVESCPLISDPFEDDNITGDLRELYDIDGLGPGVDSAPDEREWMRRLDINLAPFQISLNENQGHSHAGKPSQVTDMFDYSRYTQVKASKEPKTLQASPIRSESPIRK